MPCALASRYSSHRLGRGEPEGLIGGEFRHQVVVVGVEPLGHLGGRHAFAIVRVAVRAAVMGRLALRAARHGEIGLEADLAARPAVDRRDRAHHGGRVQHMVVEREIVGRDDVGAEIALTRPGFARRSAAAARSAAWSVFPAQ